MVGGAQASFVTEAHEGSIKMSQAVRVLLVGESWVSTSTHIKGWDFFSSSMYEEGHVHLREALSDPVFDLVHMPAHRAAADFPLSRAGLDPYDVVILSDIGANTILLHPDVWLRGKPVANRLTLLADWVRDGGSLIMAGGYLSFSGIYGSAKFYGTPIEEILPVSLFPQDDRIEVPEGAQIKVHLHEHPTVRGIGDDWPVLLGYNEVALKPGADRIADINGKPFIAAQDVGKGKSLVWTSDIGPHWCPMPFLQWPGYGKFWRQSILWLAGREV